MRNGTCILYGRIYVCLVRWTSQNTCISKITYIIHFVKAVKILEPGRIIELTNFFLSHSEYTYQRCMLVKELFTLEKTEKLINYLIDILVEYEDDSHEIKDLILGYL